MTKILKLSTRAAACILIAAIGVFLPTTSASASSYEKDSGTTIINENVWEAWAWANVWNKTQGRAYARIGSHAKDTGWFTKDCRTSSIFGPRTQGIESWARIK